MWFFRPVPPYALAAGLQLPYQFSIKKGEYPVNGIVLFAAGMLQDCMRRGITVHWDAQNEVSRHLAEKFGFEAETAYSVYWIPSLQR